MTGDDIMREFKRINAAYMASMARGPNEAFNEGAQIGRLGLSHELCHYDDGTPARLDWERGYFTGLGEKKR